MERTEFIKWLETDSGFSRGTQDSDDCWKELKNYAEYFYDILYVERDKVVFTWEEWYFGGINYHNDEYPFEDFVRLYENYDLK